MEMIAHLKDQLQEMKAKTSMEKKYIKKVCNVSVLQTQKMCNMGEKDLKDEIDVSFYCTVIIYTVLVQEQIMEIWY